MMSDVETARELDGRWIAEVPSIPGALTYGATEVEARFEVLALVSAVLADRAKHGEPPLVGIAINNR